MDPQERPPLCPWTARAWDGALAAALGTVYGATLLPGPGAHADTLEFQFIGYILGTPHPTGYPVYLALNHLVTTLVPWGSVAWRANALSAVCAVLACVAVARVLRVLGGGVREAALAALALGLGRTFWSSATVAEVYALHVALLALTLGALARWRVGGRMGDLAGAAVLLGLALAHHATTLLALPALAVLAVRGAGDLRRVGAVLPLTLGIAALAWVWLFRLATDPATPFLNTPVDSLEGFWFYVSALSFQGLVRPGATLTDLARQTAVQVGVLVPVALLGLRERGWLVGAVVALVVPQMAFYLFYDVQDAEVFLLPAWLGVAILYGRGLARLPRSWGLVTGTLGVILLAAFNLPAVDHARDAAFDARIRGVLDRVGPGAVLVTGDPVLSFACWRARYAEDPPRDLAVFHHVLDRDGLARLGAWSRGEAPLPLLEERREVAPGVPAWCVNPALIPALVEEGIRVRPVGRGLWALEGATARR